MTYRNCKKLIELSIAKGTVTAEWSSDMKNKLDVFLLNNRITKAEYDELIAMLNIKNNH